MLEEYWHTKDWDRVRFSEEIHFELRHQHHRCIICKPGEHYCIDSIQRNDFWKPKNEKFFHCWARLRYSFKSDIIFYEMLENTKGKMSLQVYMDQILKQVIQFRLMKKPGFALEKDSDSWYSKTKNRNFKRLWKQNNNMEFFFKFAPSPYLSPIENCWQPPKQHLKNTRIGTIVL